MWFFDRPNVKKLTRKKDICGLISALTYARDSAVRRAAASSLGDIGSVEALWALTNMLKEEEDNDVGARVAAADALQKIGLACCFLAD